MQAAIFLRLFGLTSPFSATNACESFHTHFKAPVDSALPNFFVQETAQEKTQN